MDQRIATPDEDTAIAAVWGRDVTPGYIYDAGPFKRAPNGKIYLRRKTTGDVRDVPLTRRPIRVVGRLRNHDTDAIAYEVAWRREDGGWHVEAVPGEVFADRSQLVKLAARGCPVDSGTASTLVEYLGEVAALNAANLPEMGSVSQLGWTADSSDFVARADHPHVRPAFLQGGQDLLDAFRAEGDPAHWHEAVAALEPYPDATVALVASLAAPLLRIVGCPSFTLHVSARSSTGKTTSLAVAASCWGEPVEGVLLRSWHATPTAIERLLASARGVPTFLDETRNLRNDTEISDVMYLIGTGQTGQRGKKNGGLDVARFETIAISTGEQKVTDLTDKEGVHARTLDLWKAPFPPDSDAVVQALRDTTREHYGHAGPAFVAYLRAHRGEWEAWRDTYRKWRDYLGAPATTDLDRRRAQYVALLVGTAGLAYQAGVLPFRVEDAYWTSLMRLAASEEDHALAALRRLVEWAETNTGRLINRASEYVEQRSPHGGWAGRWDEPRETSELCVTQRVVYEVLGPDAQSHARAWRDNGWTLTGKDNLWKRTRLQVDEQGVYCAVIPPQTRHNVLAVPGDDAPEGWRSR